MLRQEAPLSYGGAMRLPVWTALIILIAVAAAFATFHALRHPETRMSVEDAVVTLPVLPDRPGAAYFEIHASNGPAVLTAVTTPQAGRIELHQTIHRNGIARMVATPHVLVSDSAVKFEPGGRHAMLFDLAPAVRAGGTIALTFTFDGAPPVTVDADVRGPGGADQGH